MARDIDTENRADDLFAYTAAIGALAGNLLAESPRAGTRKPRSAADKAKAKNGARIAAKSRRRNRK